MGIDPTVGRIKNSHLTASIRDKILTGAYAPGSQLLQESIAAEFGVSRIPVRESLLQLCAEGLVDLLQHRGFQVRPLSFSEAEEVFSLRMQIEPAACAEGSLRARREDKVAARAAMDVMNTNLQHRNNNEIGQLNRNFHLALIVPKLQPMTTEIMSRLLTVSLRYVQRHLSEDDTMTRVMHEHLALFEAWEAGDTREVEAIARAHIDAVRRDFPIFLRDIC